MSLSPARRASVFAPDKDLVVIKKLLGHAHIGVTAGVYAHVRSASNAKPSTPYDALSAGNTVPDDRSATEAVR